MKTETSIPFDCDIEISIDDNTWTDEAIELGDNCQKTIETALTHVLPEFELENAPHGVALEISILFTDDNKIQKLNRDYRQKDSSTNVLSFPDTDLTVENLQEAANFSEPLMLGDIVFAEETIRREAAEQNKKFKDHLTHLTVHGFLHLVGYDHIMDEEADHMEAQEIQILAKLNIDNPYQIGDIFQDGAA